MSAEPDRAAARARVEAAEEEITRYERNVFEALRRMSRRTHYEPASVDTPISEVLGTVDDELDEWAVRRATVTALFAYFLADGPEPWNVMRRVFLLGDHMMIRPFCELTLREKAKLLGCSHEDVRFWIKRLCVNPLMRIGAASFKAPGQKSLRAGEVAAEAQRGNDNRSKNHRPKSVRGPGAADRKKRKPKTRKQ